MSSYNDYVISYWCKIDDPLDCEYKYIPTVRYNEAVWEAQRLSDEFSIQEHRAEIYDLLTEECGEEWPSAKFVDAFEKVMFNFTAFAVYRVLPGTPRKIIEDEFDSDPENFILRWCVRED